MKKSLAISAASAAVLLALTACGSSDTDQATDTTAASATMTSASAEAGTGEHNDADVAFAQGMIPHHTQAIEMSDTLLAKEGIDPRVTALAEQIKSAQTPEIEQLNAWLAEWGQSASSTPMSSGMDMPGMSTPMSTGMSMPDMEGMMSPEDMQALANAQGVDAARLFLTQMIEHHRGAIAMAQTEVDTGQYPAAVQMAQNIIDTQQKEITTMEELLSSL
ncbi:DUF305 domain-containing protein (plasmid) [Rhodococcus oxybenzonivorans]|uniref:DUF305 domain-containing protein n=1 Tax=Rhodococcus oxybenzonivorans TaxID=1990687 RepID=A0A2S2C7D4_9NOCA|nr:DUF305 domain-containing protein [Rhodococcus oxybenzonivorans]AWK76786.1 DUF305 domain-containing protein [Rhodococcus oxybenzonivorans]